MEVVPDDFSLIEDRLHHYVDAGVDFIFTTGGTGFTPDDITPEATRAVIQRVAPGIAEAMRAVSAQHTPMGDPQPRRRRHQRPHADRQLPRLAEGGRGVLRRARAGARATPCARCAVTPAIELDRSGARVRRARRVPRPLASRSTTGETLAVLGRNGAGKTTLLRMLATLLRPHAGTVRVLGARAAARGLQGARAARAARARAAALPRPDRAREPALPRAPARRRVRAHRELLEQVGLTLRADEPLRTALARDGPARRDLPRGAARARAAAARRALRQPRPARGRAGRAAARAPRARACSSATTSSAAARRGRRRCWSCA